MHKINSFQDAVSFLESDRFIRPAEYKRIEKSSQLLVHGSQQETFSTMNPEPTNREPTPLDRMRHFLELLGDPQEKFPSVVVSGTSGKGSTTTMIASMLTKAGYKTGMTISPHLETIRERLQINGEYISEDAFVSLLNTTIPAIEKLGKTRFGEPSYFEILLAMTFLYFAQKEVDIAVVEVGLEGKFDGTNILNPLFFVLTNISLDHTNILGNTIEEIAEEATERIRLMHVVKGKKQRVVVTGVSQESVIGIVKKKCREAGVKLLRSIKDFGFTIQKEQKNGSIFKWSDYKKLQELKDIKLCLLGDYQVENASLAIEALMQLQQFGFSVSEKVVKQALSTITVPGRFEVIKFHGKDVATTNFEPITNNHTIILDGAHNPAKMHAFLEEFKKRFVKEKNIFIVAFTKGHLEDRMMQEILMVADTIIFTNYTVTTDMGTKRSAQFSSFNSQFSKIKNKRTKEVLFVDNPEKALKRSWSLTNHEPFVVVTGSLYLVGEIKKLLHQQPV